MNPAMHIRCTCVGLSVMMVFAVSPYIATWGKYHQLKTPKVEQYLQRQFMTLGQYYVTEDAMATDRVPDFTGVVCALSKDAPQVSGVV